MSKSDSSQQRKAEEIIRNELSKDLQLKLIKRKVVLSDGSIIELDGIDDDKKVIVEIVARIGTRSASRDRKISCDGFKMDHLTKNEPKFKGYRKIIAGCCDEFLNNYRSGSKKWIATALEASGIEVKTVNLSEADRGLILQAQKDQSHSKDEFDLDEE